MCLRIATPTYNVYMRSQETSPYSFINEQSCSFVWVCILVYIHLCVFFDILVSSTACLHEGSRCKCILCLHDTLLAL